MPPALSLREEIFRNVQTTLAAITANGTYASMLATIGRGHIPPLETSALPIAAILPVTDEPDDAPQTLRRTLTLTVRVWVDVALADTASTLEALIADVQYALQVDPRRGGHAENTREITLTYLYLQNTETLAGADIGIQIDYKTALTSPRVQV